MNLETKYLGLELKNPVIVSSSGLTDSVEKIKKLEEYGAGAVVLKSLFEEQINYEVSQMMEHADYPEAEDYIRNYSKNNSVEEYLSLIEKAKRETGIPVIASINCISANDWISFAKRIEDAGADALEINVFYFPSDKRMKADDYERIYYDLASKLKNEVSLPIAFKLGSHFTNLVRVVDELYFRGVKGVVLFNRFYEPDIDVDNMKFKAGEIFTSPSDISKSLRWVGIISDKNTEIDIAASTGVHDGKAVAKQLLVGADAVMICSVLYKKGPEYLGIILHEFKRWMEKYGYDSINDFHGKMSYTKLKDPAIYERSQFMKYFSHQQ
ncbi:MAG: dihydroorotate dehydrogenase-like protein [Bacteroidales bacterium]